MRINWKSRCLSAEEELAANRACNRYSWKEQALELHKALTGLVEIGKRDMCNPKYDGYWETARDVLSRFHGKCGPNGGRKQ